MKLIKVTFEPHNNQFSKVVGEYENGESEVVYLDNIATKMFLQQALMQSQVMQGGIWL